MPSNGKLLSNDLRRFFFQAQYDKMNYRSRSVLRVGL